MTASRPTGTEAQSAQSKATVEQLKLAKNLDVVRSLNEPLRIY
jgi:hypothetical protein